VTAGKNPLGTGFVEEWVPVERYACFIRCDKIVVLVLLVVVVRGGWERGIEDVGELEEELPGNRVSNEDHIA
jgi:hypothetical protein